MFILWFMPTECQVDYQNSPRDTMKLSCLLSCTVHLPSMSAYETQISDMLGMVYVFTIIPRNAWCAVTVPFYFLQSIVFSCFSCSNICPCIAFQWVSMCVCDHHIAACNMLSTLRHLCDFCTFTVYSDLMKHLTIHIDASHESFRLVISLVVLRWRRCRSCFVLYPCVAFVSWLASCLCCFWVFQYDFLCSSVYRIWMIPTCHLLRLFHALHIVIWEMYRIICG